MELKSGREEWDAMVDQNCVELAQGKITWAEFKRRAWEAEKKAEARRRRKAAYRLGKAEGRRTPWS